jgi:methylenetetrahydrofolate dehydrogenase (NADP+)/methenyltetrahydrofolate cyclohydrolase
MDKKVIDGKNLSIKLKEELKNEIKRLKINPTLVVIQVGNDDASNTYVKGKANACRDLCINFQLIHYNNDVNSCLLESKIKQLNKDSNINGILVQLPLPKHLDSKKIIDLIDPIKDVDGLTPINIGNLAMDREGIISCTPKGIMKLLDNYNVDIKGKYVVIVGRSILVGKPLGYLFLNRDATVTICHSKTIDLEKYTKEADILVVATGHKHLINKDMIKDNAILIDVGVNRIDNKLYGDINYNDVYDKCSLITPVPGGVGPMTVCMLLYNVVECYKKQYNIK